MPALPIHHWLESPQTFRPDVELILHGRNATAVNGVFRVAARDVHRRRFGLWEFRRTVVIVHLTHFSRSFPSLAELEGLPEAIVTDWARAEARLWLPCTDRLAWAELHTRVPWTAPESVVDTLTQAAVHVHQRAQKRRLQFMRTMAEHRSGRAPAVRPLTNGKLPASGRQAYESPPDNRSL